MKVVINALQYKKDSSGVGVVLRELFGRYASLTASQCEIYLPRGSPVFSVGGRARCVFAPFRYEQGFFRVLYQAFVLGMRCGRDAVLLVVDSKVPFLLSEKCRVVPLITDLALFRIPGIYQRSRVLLWRLQYHFLLRRADLFLTISEFTKREMIELFGISPERIEVVPCAASNLITQVIRRDLLQVTRQRYHLPEHYVLFVGNSNPRKNLRRLVHAFDQMKRKANLPHCLVIAGGQGWRFDAGQVLDGVESRDDVKFIGYVADDDLSALYTAADLFVFPSLYEGFGIPVIEAQQCGTPVLTSKGSALEEVGGDGAYYVDPYSEEAIAAGMYQLLTDLSLRERLICAGRENTRRFSWERSAHRLDEIVEGRRKVWE